MYGHTFLESLIWIIQPLKVMSLVIIDFFTLTVYG